MHKLPVIGFNSGKYDLNAVKQFLVPYFLSTSKTEEQQEEDEEEKEQDDRERRKERWCRVFFHVSFDGSAAKIPRRDQLYSLGCEVTKGHFPYEYMDCLTRQDDTAITTLRQNEYGEAARPCRSIVGYDANALYLWSLVQDMRDNRWGGTRDGGKRTTSGPNRQTGTDRWLRNG